MEAILFGQTDIAQPLGDRRERPSFLIGLHREAFQQPRLWRMSGQHGQAVAEPVTAMGDKGNQRLPR